MASLLLVLNGDGVCLQLLLFLLLRVLHEGVAVAVGVADLVALGDSL